MAVFADGREAGRTSGARPAAEIESFIESTLAAIIDGMSNRVAVQARPSVAAQVRRVRAGTPSLRRGGGRLGARSARRHLRRPDHRGRDRAHPRAAAPGAAARAAVRAAGPPRDDARGDRGGAMDRGGRRAGRRLRRLPAPRRDRGLAHRRRAPRDPARDGADARHRQSPEDASSPAARCATARPRSRARASARSGRKRSTPPASGCVAATRIRDADGWRGDVVAPLIRDLGRQSLARMRRRDARRRGPHACCRRRWARPGRRCTARTCTSAISRRGVLPAAAPLRSAR